MEYMLSWANSTKRVANSIHSKFWFFFFHSSLPVFSKPSPVDKDIKDACFSSCVWFSQECQARQLNQNCRSVAPKSCFRSVQENLFFSCNEVSCSVWKFVYKYHYVIEAQNSDWHKRSINYHLDFIHGKSEAYYNSQPIFILEGH